MLENLAICWGAESGLTWDRISSVITSGRCGRRPLVRCGYSRPVVVQAFDIDAVARGCAVGLSRATECEPGASASTGRFALRLDVLAPVLVTEAVDLDRLLSASA